MPLSASGLMPGYCPPGDLSDAVFFRGMSKQKHGSMVFRVPCYNALVRDLVRASFRALWLPGKRGEEAKRIKNVSVAAI